MALADDILNEFDEQQYEEDVRHNSEDLEYRDIKQTTKETTKEAQEEAQEEIQKETSEEIQKEDKKIDIKQLSILIVSTAVAYVIIIQYKLLDPVLNMHLPDISLLVKRFVSFSIIISIIYTGLKLSE